MYLTETFFKQTAPALDHQQAYHALNKLIDEWRYNGQIIGREISLYLAQDGEDSGFIIRAVCPEQHSLLPEWNNAFVTTSLENLAAMGLVMESLQIIAEDLNAEITSQEKPSWQVLYTSFVQSCSPLHNGEDFLPLPLYRFFHQQPDLSREIIKWQENWQAFDQLQMNATSLEKEAVAEISNVDTRLFKQGYALCREIEQLTGTPTYYYLYRVGGESLEAEENRLCPCCGKPWRLVEPLFNVLSFKCDTCRLVSNLSWDF